MKYTPVRSVEFSTVWGMAEHRARSAMSPARRSSTAAFSPTPSTVISSSAEARSTPCMEPNCRTSRCAVSLVSCRGMAKNNSSSSS